MARYGWSGRGQISPYSSMSGATPSVTDEDFSYITSQDIDDPTIGAPSDSRRQYTVAPEPEDDVLLIKYKGVTYPAHFPAYAIGDGKLRVKDVIDRMGLMMGQSKRGARRMKLVYKARQLKDLDAPVREYGVKNNSELMAALRDADGTESMSDEEIVDVDVKEDSKSRRRNLRKKSKKKEKATGEDSMTSSPHASSSAFEPHSPPQQVSSNPAWIKLGELTTEFDVKWRPLCDDYIKAPPADKKKREDEHRKLSESMLQQILLKADAVETDGVDEIRTRRKALVKGVQDLLKELDVAKGSMS